MHVNKLYVANQFVRFAHAEHTFAIENCNQIVVRDCAGLVMFRCDVENNDLVHGSVGAGEYLEFTFESLRRFAD